MGGAAPRERTFRRTALTLLMIAAGLGQAQRANATPINGTQVSFDALVAQYDQWVLADNPFLAASEGDRSALTKLPDVTPAADARRKAALESFQARLTSVTQDQLSDEGRLNLAFLRHVISDALESLAFDEAAMPISSDGGFYTAMAYAAATTPISNSADAEAWLARLAAVPQYYADNIANLRRGLREGFVQPTSTVDAVLRQARAQADAPVASDSLMTPLGLLPPSIPVAQQTALRNRAQALIAEKIRPAQSLFVQFLQTEYRPHARTSLGIASLPQGRRYYSWLVSHYTTTGLTPDKIHAIGQVEVARIRSEMVTVISETGFKGSFPEFLAYLRSDPRFYASSRDSLLEKASEIAKRIDDQLPRWFVTLPRLTYGVRPVPAAIEDGYTTGRYFSGSPAQGVAGGYMVNTSHLDQRPLYELPALTLHEAVPGHHLQIALAQELQAVPAFRRNADMTAFTEGWGLYAESLGLEMGIYRNAYERFGRLSYEMWRACRLVADTGIHWKGWTLDQARSCFTENTALSAKTIDVELARYISWAGQALGYKIGELKLLELRARARSELGDRFDIRRFHDAVLLAGPLPLDLLETRIDAWIAAEKTVLR